MSVESLFISTNILNPLVPITPRRSWGNHGHRQATESTKGLLFLVALIFSELFKMEGPPWRLGQYPEGWHSREDYWSLRICFQRSTSAHMIHATIPALVPIKGPFCRATKTAVAFRPTWGDFEVVCWHNTVTDHMGAFITSWRNRASVNQRERGRRWDAGPARQWKRNKQIRLTGDQPNVSDCNEASVARGNAWYGKRGFRGSSCTLLIMFAGILIVVFNYFSAKWHRWKIGVCN